MIHADLGRLPCTAGGNRRSRTCPIYTIAVKTDLTKEPTAARVQALGWGAAIGDKLNPLGQSLAAINEPFDCSLATSQLQASAQEVVMQPSDSHLMHTILLHEARVHKACGIVPYLIAQIMILPYFDFADLYREAESVSDLITRNPPRTCFSRVSLKSVKAGTFSTQLRACR